jgi:hypothetical protein
MQINIRKFLVVIRTTLLTLLLGLLFFAKSTPLPVGAKDLSSSSTDNIWADVDEASISFVNRRDIIPERYRTLSLDLARLDALLASAPLESSKVAQTVKVVVPIPLPDHGFGNFQFVEAPIMAPELAAKFPEIKTYLGWGLDDPSASVRFDRTPAGFHAMILSSNGTIFVDPFSRDDPNYYISYFKRDYMADSDISFQEYGPLQGPTDASSLVTQIGRAGTTSGNQLRTYRAAVAATGEYTQFFDGTVNAGMAAIVTTMNRVVGIYEREVAVRMVLVANNDLIVYTDADGDPYTNSNGSAMLSENQATLDAIIDNANYDIGHVFSTGGGGVAYLGVPCIAGWKAQGVTGRSQPVGDAFDVDYVAHEMGHQFGANHTFNGNEGSCSGGNRHASTAYEPGSASTIMGYAGICGSQDLQPHSDDYFHGVSLDEIIAYTTVGSGNNCPVVTATGNSAPVVEAGVGGFTIPKNTPFILTGSATDPDGDPLTYTWEEFDLGPAGHPDYPTGSAPIFRSFTPVTVPWRTFPKISDLVNDIHTIGELLPSYSRSLTFRLTVRDNHVSPSAGGVGSDSITFNVTGLAGPFQVTEPNTAVTWWVGTQSTVNWEVANTNTSPVNCTGVNILLSTDGGYTYPFTLATNTPNDGSATVTVPRTPTNSARVKVACANNIFFDISNTDFLVDGSFIYFPLIRR